MRLQAVWCVLQTLKQEGSLEIRLLFGWPLRGIANCWCITDSRLKLLALCGLEKGKEIPPGQSKKCRKRQHTSQGIYFRRHKEWFKAFVFLLNEDHADCLDTWNLVVLWLQLGGKTTFSYAQINKSGAYFQTQESPYFSKVINDTSGPYKALTVLAYCTWLMFSRVCNPGEQHIPCPPLLQKPH